MSEGEPSGGRWMKPLYCRASVCYIYKCVFIYMPYVHNWRVRRRFYGLNLKRKWSSWKTRHGRTRFLNDGRKWLQIRRPMERQLEWMYTWLAWWSVSVLERLLEFAVFFSLDYSLHEHALALDVILVLASRNYFQSC